MSKLTLATLTMIALTLPATADPLLEMMRTHSKDGPLYAYEMSYTDSGLTATGRIDPSQPEGQRIEIYTPEKSAWTDDFEAGLAEMETEIDGDIWCANFAENVPERADLKIETETSATYAFTPKPDAGADGMEKKLMKKIKGEIILAKADGAILGFSMTLPKPFKPAIIAKINVFNMSVSCVRAPDGRTYVEEFAMTVSGSAMMQKFEETVSRKITALLDPVG